MASENGSEAEDTQENDNDTENDSEETESNSYETSTLHSENPCEHWENSNVYGTLIMKCPNCSWHDSYKICPRCVHQIPEERNNMKVIYFHPFQISVFYSFCYWFSIKDFFKTVARVCIFFLGAGGAGGERLLVACFN